MPRYLLALAATLALASGAHADFLTDRPTLDALLGAGETLERFEAYDINPGDAERLTVGDSQSEFITLLDAATVAGEQGPGLVVGGVAFSTPDPSGLQWNGVGYFGLSTESISAFGRTLAIDFTGPTTAFGVDLEIFRGFPTTVDVTVFAADDATVLGSRTGISLAGPSPVFLGFADDGGIGRMTLTSTDRTFSPVIDNLAFGARAVPEPSSLALLGIAGIAGLAWRRARST